MTNLDEEVRIQEARAQHSYERQVRALEAAKEVEINKLQIQYARLSEEWIAKHAVREPIPFDLDEFTRRAIETFRSILNGYKTNP